MALQEILPDPNYRISGGGDNASGSYGPGFAQIKLNNSHKVLSTRTNSQRLIARSIAGQKWDIGINYNPMTREEFEPVVTFLLGKQGPLTPFFVSLPQYRASQNSTWDTTVLNANYTPRVNGAVVAAKSEVMVEINTTGGATAYSIGSMGYPTPGDMCTFTNHTKAYLITRVETPSDNQTAIPDANNFRLTLSPSLSKAVSDEETINFSKPLIKVVLPKPLASYTLNKDNLYSFSLKLEEYL